jgi:hypothetical protein
VTLVLSATPVMLVPNDGMMAVDAGIAMAFRAAARFESR